MRTPSFRRHAEALARQLPAAAALMYGEDHFLADPARLDQPFPEREPMSTTPPIPTVGRIVLVPVETRVSYGDGEGPKPGPIVVRPAIVVRVFERTDGEMSLINVRVFTDGANDNLLSDWGTSLHYSQEDHRVGTWHWMPYQLETAGTRHPDAPKGEDAKGSLTVRDEFAARAIPPTTNHRPGSILQWWRWFFGLSYRSTGAKPECVAESAYALADEMIKKREKV